MADSLIEKINAGGATYVVHDANAVPNTRKINDVVLNTDITLSGDDVKLTGYTKGSSTAAVLATDKVNEAIAKHENRIDANQTNILSVEDMVCATEFSSSTAYAVGDMVTYEHKLYKFINAHQGAWSASDVQNYDLTRLESEDRASLAEVVDFGAKNKLKLDKDAIKSLNSGGTWSRYVYTPTTAPNLTVTINDDGTVTLNGSTSSSLVTVALERKASSGFQGYVLSGSKANTKLVYQLAVSPYTVYATADGVGSDVIANYTDGSTIQLSLQIVANSTFINTIITPMICTEADWKVSQNYAPFALPNYDLTVREAEDRNVLVEVVDEGAKNKLDFASLEYADGHGAPTVTKTDTTITIASGNAWARAVYSGIHLKAGTYVLSVNITSATFATGIVGTIRIVDNAWATGGVAYIEFNSIGKVSCIFTVDTEADLYFSFCPNYSGGDLSTVNSFTATDVMICTKAEYDISPNYEPHALPNTDLTRMMTPFFTVPINHNMIYRGQNLGDTLTADQDTALSSGNFTDLYLGDYWTKTVTIPAGTYTGGDGEEVTVPAQTNITLKAVIADFDTFYAGYASTYAGINTHHAAVIVTGFSNVVWNKTDSTAGGYVNSLIHKWLVGSVLPQIETWFGSAKVLSHQKLLTNAITGDAASGWGWSSQKISLLSENQMYGSKVWGNSKAANGGYEPGEAFKHLNVFNHIDANLLFDDRNVWLRDIASAVGAACLSGSGRAGDGDASGTWFAPAALILLS